MEDIRIDRLMEVIQENLKNVNVALTVLSSVVEEKKENDRFLDYKEVSRITGQTEETSKKIICMINKKVKEDKGTDHVRKGLILESNLFEFHKLGKEGKA